jgi:hypothetical protein
LESRKILRRKTREFALLVEIEKCLECGDWMHRDT